jgi:hypothetical protein
MLNLDRITSLKVFFATQYITILWLSRNKRIQHINITSFSEAKKLSQTEVIIKKQ